MLKKKKVSLAILAIGVECVAENCVCRFGFPPPFQIPVCARIRSYFQILSIFASTRADWPDLIVQIYDYFSIFSFK